MIALAIDDTYGDKGRTVVEMNIRAAELARETGAHGESLQRHDVGGIPGLRLFARRQLHFFVEYLAELLRRIDIEFTSG